MHIFKSFILVAALILPSFFAQAEIENVEIQWAVCEASADHLVRKLGYQVEDEGAYMISYFDTPELALKMNGVSARATQKIKGSKNKYKSKIKVEFQSAEEIDWDWLGNYDSKCEYDQYGLTILPRCSISNKPLKNGSLWSREQVDLLNKFRPGISLINMQQWGPYQGREIELSLSASLTATITEVTVGRRATSVMEFSIRAPIAEAARVYQHFSSTLRSRGVHLCATQEGMFDRIVPLALQ